MCDHEAEVNERPVRRSKRRTIFRWLERAFLGLGRARAGVRHLFRRLTRKPRTVAESPNLLPTLIKVFAAFARVDGELLEEEIDSSLGFLRYDYPEAVYSELRQLFREALHEQQNLGEIAAKLSGQLDDERKILLGVQLYDLISKAGLKQDQVVAYYSFMSELGMATQAIDIVYQLNSNGHGDGAIYHQGASPLESISFGPEGGAEVALRDFVEGQRILAYRYRELILLKNLSGRVLIVGGRGIKVGDFCRIFPGQRVLIDDQVLTHADLVFYFNAKKGVLLPQIFIGVNDHDEVSLEKNRSRDSILEVTFGLCVQVTALADVDAVLKGVRLKTGTKVNATLEDKIIFHDDSELDLGDLRRRARQYGGRFQLKASRSEYLVSNNPGLLREGDILLSPGSGGDVLLKIFCNYERREGVVEVLQSDRPILVRGVPVRNRAELADGDAIRIDAGQVLRCNFSERILEEERNIIRQLEVRDLTCKFRGNQTALDGISFSVQRGEMVCVMGASGCGKSTLMRALAGQFPPAQGSVLFNGRSLYGNFDGLRKYVAYIPQDDAFDEHLTIEENLSFAAELRAPYLSRTERARRIDGKLAELGLNERRGYVVGPAHRKTLSGGERKRLNIGLDMIGSADVYLFDEPTSGLSSKDSEHVLDIIRGISHNKIVLVTIHQPTSKMFQMFHKAVLLDRGGKLVFFGTPAEMLKYFAEAEHEQHFGTALGGCEACGTTRPEFIFDVLETPLRDLSGDIIFEENNRGQLVPARRFPPDFWRDKYESYRLLKDVQGTGPPREAPGGAGSQSRRREPVRWRDEWGQFRVLLLRAFVSKLRNRANLTITLLAAPALALLIGFVLRYSGEESYDFASAFHIPTYLFLSLVVAMFLGLTNSVDDITRDKPVLFRERNLNVRLGYYVFAKALTLAIFALIQSALFTWVGNALLEVRGVFWLVFAAMFLTTVSGFAIGLLVSCVVSESKTGVLIIPVVLIPQIILAGALIEYEEMNRNLDFVYVLEEWTSKHPGQPPRERSELKVPIICELMPMRWSYEALVFAQAKLNPYTARQEKIQREITRLATSKGLSDSERQRLDDLKDLLAITSGLQAGDAASVDRGLALVDRVIAGAPLVREDFRRAGSGVTAEQLYVNQKVTDLVSKAEMEQSDYRESRHLNVFFGPVKEYLGIRAGLIPFNAAVLIGSSLGAFFLLYLILRRQIRA
ncbi:MAG: hypothetical protein Fur0032_22900 [Terrimicrobiaceae bacterium]